MFLSPRQTSRSQEGKPVTEAALIASESPSASPEQVEFCIHAANGEPEGAVEASSAAEAAELWAIDNLHNGDGRLLQVMEGAGHCGWYEVLRDRDSAKARACTV
jgi:hypothetical protein